MADERTSEALDLDRLMRARPASSYAGKVARGEASPLGPLYAAYPTEEERVAASTQSLEERLEEIAGPMRRELEALDAEIRDRIRALDLLHEDRANLAEILERLERPAAQPEPEPAPEPAPEPPAKQSKYDPPANGGYAKFTAAPYVRDFIARGKVDRNRIVAEELARAIKADGEAQGLRPATTGALKPDMYPGAPRVVRAVKELAADGVLVRKRKRSKGGGIVYHYAGPSS